MMYSFHGQYQIKAMDMDNAGAVSSLIKRELRKIGIDNATLRRVAIATYEAEINIVIHSYGGTVEIDVEGHQIQISFKDVGPGIECIDKALIEGFSTANEYARQQGFGAGMGLPNIKKVVDEFYLESSHDGTTLIIKFNIPNNDC